MNKNELKIRLIEVFAFIWLGAFLMTGMRIAEWLIPEPETKFFICFPDDVKGDKDCKNLHELITIEG